MAETLTLEPEISTSDLADTRPARAAAETEPGLRAPEPETMSDEDELSPLFPREATSELRRRWTEIQTGFVDEPRAAVKEADALVAQTMKRLAVAFADERGHLEEQWTRGDAVSTEDLRQAMRRYRSFFDRLLSF